jgi:mevalonate kinase
MEFRANGKLLLSAEYAVLDGATALALPTRLGQTLSISLSDDSNGHWRSYDADGSLWFEADFDIRQYDILKTNNSEVAEQLVKILQACRFLKMNSSEPPPQYKAMTIETRLDFPRHWGLGTSSTLIYNLAQVFKINPYVLLEKTFGGSGYDIACAAADTPILFTLNQGQALVEPVPFKPAFAHQLYFVFLNKKQNSREGIHRFREKMKETTPSSPPKRVLWTKESTATVSKPIFEETTSLKDKFSQLTQAFLKAKTLTDFEQTLYAHEELVSNLIQLPRAKSLYFNDFWGEIKSLGAWGGDFVLATSSRSAHETQAYFKERGFPVVLPYADIIFQNMP